MNKWQYTTDAHRLDNPYWPNGASYEEDWLKHMGENCWELVTVCHTTDYIYYYFKRPV